MTTPPTYEFDEEEAPKPARRPFIPGLDMERPAEPPAAPAQPPGQSPGKPAGQIPGRPPVLTPSYTPAPGTPGTGRHANPNDPRRNVPLTAAPPRVAITRSTPGAGSPPVGQQPGQQAATEPAAEADDPDLKPGSRKDLWSCPHCGTGNRPGRTTCRACGKSPDDAVAPKFYTQPVFFAWIGGALVAILLLWFVTRPDLTLHPAAPAAVDSKVRRGSATTKERELVGKTFTPHGRLAVTGRICASRTTPGVDGTTTVVLLLGKAAADDQLDSADVTFNNELVNGPPGSVVLHLITSQKLDLTKGAWLSVVGDYGELAEGALLVRGTDVGYAVAVDQLAQ